MESYHYSLRRCLPEKSKKLTDAIVAFLERGDNSSNMPGKDDFVNCNGEKVQNITSMIISIRYQFPYMLCGQSDNIFIFLG